MSVALAKTIEDCLIALLQADGSLAGLEIASASDRGALVPPLHAFVFCIDAHPLLPAGPLYRPEVTLTLVTSIHDHPQAEREAWLVKLHQRLRDLGLWFESHGGSWTHSNLSIVGLALKGTREFSQADQTGDALDLTLGVVAD